MGDIRLPEEIHAGNQDAETGNRSHSRPPEAAERENLTVRAAQSRTGVAAADFSRIRNADLGRFTVDRLMSILNRLGSRIEVKVSIRRVSKSAV